MRRLVILCFCLLLKTSDASEADGVGLCGYLKPSQDVTPSQCATASSYLACVNAPYNNYCVEDGSCSMSRNLNNCGAFDVYYKTKLVLHQGVGRCGYVRELNSADCPTYIDIPPCKDVYYGELCDGGSSMWKSSSLNNCGADDLYRKEKLDYNKGVGSCGALSTGNCKLSLHLSAFYWLL
eukprot:m.251899 g.251899  ORF g.251899 m.251899 type:complete len:180 (-) comp16153_c0_seq1:1006-1545(-)